MASSGGYVSAQKNGLAIIITNDYRETNLQQLTGAHSDGDKMERVFEHLRYDICRWKNYTCRRLQESLHQIVLGIGHSNYGCIVVIFSGHGTADAGKLTYIFTQDYHSQMFPVHEMVNYFMPKTSPAIATTPKVFLIDSCLGETDTYKEVVTVPKGGYADVTMEAPITEKGGRPIATIDVPPEGNFILAHSTSIGYRSYEREPYGGIWLNSLGDKIQYKAHCDSVMNILSEVNGDLLHMYQQKTFKQAMTQPCVMGQAHGTVYFVPQLSQGAMADFMPQQSQGAMADFMPQQSQGAMADFVPQQSQGAMADFMPQHSQRTMAVHNGTPPAAKHESSSLNGSMGAMSMHESPSTFSPLISCKTHLNNMWQAKRISEPHYDDLKSMGSVMKYLAKVTFKLLATNQTLFFESLDPKVHMREAREEAAKFAYEYLLDVPARQTPKSALTRQGSSPQQLPMKKQSSSDNTPMQVLKMACESARYKYELSELNTHDIQKFQFKVTVRDGISTGRILCEEVGLPQGSKKAAKHDAASRVNAKFGFS